MEHFDPRIDAYIEKAADFAKPILKHIRHLVHLNVPQITETVKWGMPFFEYKGQICNIAAFKQHCAMGFWNRSLLQDPYHVLNSSEEPAMGSFGRITQLSDLPTDEIISDFLLQAVEINEKGIKKPKPVKSAAERSELMVPEDFNVELNANPQVKETFEKFSYSNKKEYLEWFAEAKTEATRQKRIQTAVEWIGEGKTRMWKYK